MRKVLFLTTAACLAAVVLFLLFTLPPSPSASVGEVDEGIRRRTVAGAYHVHSTTSDGTADRNRIAAAARRASLRFVVFSDHGDGTRLPDPPRYVDGVLCLDAVEISTNGGHYVALDMRMSPYPLGGDTVAVVEDVRRLGGFGIAAHPDSTKQELAWTDWTPPIDGLEWLNADSEWRDESARMLARVALSYPVRKGPALAALFDRPVTTLKRWDELAATRPVVGLGAHDAHGGLSGGEDGQRTRIPGIPSYEASFRSFAIRTVLEAPLSGEPAADGRLVLDAIRRGRVFTAIDAVAGPAWLDFHAIRGGTRAAMGDALPFDDDISLVVRATMPPGGRAVLLCDGVSVAESEAGQIIVRALRPAACRAEVLAARAPGDPPVPWLVGNPIYLLPTVIEPVGREPIVETIRALDALDWTVEKEPQSAGAFSKVDGGFAVDYQLRGGDRVSQYVAASAPLHPPLPPYDRIQFTAQSASPMRISVQVRLEGGERWVRSVYVEPDPRRITVLLTDLVQAERSSQPQPDFRAVSSLLFVVDLTNAKPASAGNFQITDLILGRPVPGTR